MGQRAKIEWGIYGQPRAVGKICLTLEILLVHTGSLGVISHGTMCCAPVLLSPSLLCSVMVFRPLPSSAL